MTDRQTDSCRTKSTALFIALRAPSHHARSSSWASEFLKAPERACCLYRKHMAKIAPWVGVWGTPLVMSKQQIAQRDTAKEDHGTQAGQERRRRVRLLDGHTSPDGRRGFE